MIIVNGCTSSGFLLSHVSLLFRIMTEYLIIGQRLVISKIVVEMIDLLSPKLENHFAKRAMY